MKRERQQNSDDEELCKDQKSKIFPSDPPVRKRIFNKNKETGTEQSQKIQTQNMRDQQEQIELDNQRKTRLDLSRILNTIDQYYYKSVQHLNLVNKGDIWVKVLNKKQWNKLRKLSLIRCKINNNNIDSLVNKKWPQLETLQIRQNRITKYGMQTLLCKANFNKLLNLDLNYTYIGSEGIKLLVKMKIPHIQYMSLNGCRFGDEGAFHLTKGNWTQLKWLCIEQNDIKVSGFQAIASSSILSKINLLSCKYFNEKDQNIAYASLIVIDSQKGRINLKWVWNKQMKSDLLRIFGSKFKQQKQWRH